MQCVSIRIYTIGNKGKVIGNRYLFNHMKLAREGFFNWKRIY